MSGWWISKDRYPHNADTPKDASTARKFGAEGIGLCRTEHMFFEGPRIKLFEKWFFQTILKVERKLF
jgi:pyruvate,orthophosphate dikinase